MQIRMAEPCATSIASLCTIVRLSLCPVAPALIKGCSEDAFASDAIQ